MLSLTPARAERIIGAALSRPGGAELVFGTLADLAGVEYAPGQARGFLRAAAPPTLRVGDWTFAVTGRGNALEAGHTVRDVILSRTVMAPAEAAGKLTPALLEAARQHGSEAEERTDSVVGALGEVLGL